MKDVSIRVRLWGQESDTFKAAKAKTERELGVTLRDNEFARRVVVQAVKEMVK